MRPGVGFLLAALAIVAMLVFLVIAIGAAGLGLAFLSGAPHAFGASPGLSAGLFAVAVLFFYLAYLALRSAVKRIKEASASGAAHNVAQASRRL